MYHTYLWYLTGPLPRIAKNLSHAGKTNITRAPYSIPGLFLQSQLAQTEEFMFQNVAYKPTVYKTGIPTRASWIDGNLE